MGIIGGAHVLAKDCAKQFCDRGDGEPSQKQYNVSHTKQLSGI